MVFWEGCSDILEESPAHGGAAVTDAAFLTSRLVAALQHRRPTVRVLAKVAVFRPEPSPMMDHERPTVGERPFLVFLSVQSWLTVLLLFFFFHTRAFSF